MRRKSILIVAAMVVGLALGAVFGPTIGSTVASAQSQPPGQAAPTSPGTNGPGDALRSLFLDKLAAALNIQRSALDSAITSAGASAADAAVQQGTLTQEQADALKARVQAGDVGALWGGRGFGGHGPMDGGVRDAMVTAVAKALNITPDELMTQLHGGQTLAQIAQAHNTTEQAVVDAALAAAKTQLAQSVTDGKLTQAQADSIYAQLQQQGAQVLTPRGPHGHGPMGGPGAPQSPTAPQAPTTPQSSSTNPQA